MESNDQIRILTQIPGPRSQELKALRDAHVPRGIYSATEIFAAKGFDALIEDVDGNRYIDFAGGIGTLNVGYSVQPIVEAVKQQVERFFHTCFSVMMYEPYVELARRLNAIAPGTAPKKTMFGNSGAEAVENAVKIARYATGRTTVVAFDGAFHGRTHLTVSMTGRDMPYRKGFGPKAVGVEHLPFAYCYRCPFKLSPDNCGLACLDYADNALRTRIGADNVAAIIVEPVQGEAGFIVPPAGFLSGLKRIAEEHQILFIDDEIQAGYGRTGKMWAIEHFGIEPDLMTFGKSVAAGLPLSGVTGKADVMDRPHPGSLGGTYPGNPVACAAGVAVLEFYERERVLERAQHLGTLIQHRLQEMQERHPAIGEVRGIGPMAALELVRNRETKEPASEETLRLIKRCHSNGLVIIRAGIYDNVVRILVPLTAPEEIVHRGLDILEDSLEAVLG
jgi:4-aminobutyrate aminotransferase/(S)-3-amino-2-methylpropionate transaminase